MSMLCFVGFSLNGAILTDSFEDPIAFNHFNVSGGFMPAVTLGPDQLVKLNFGNNEVCHIYITVVLVTIDHSHQVRSWCDDIYAEVPLC